MATATGKAPKIKCFKGAWVPPVDINDKLRWYWNTFASEQRSGLTWEEWLEGSKIESDGRSNEDLKNDFDKLSNKKGRIWCNSFMSMAGEARNGKNVCWEGEVLPNNINNKMRWYWNKFATETDDRMVVTMKEWMEGSEVESGEKLESEMYRKELEE